ncbi:MAG TPA: protein translocase subunit SecF [Bryobacteraceae bacterium]|nr:protein translocase subunit SecF [Bryobacteraceae bacterium]
MQLFKNTNFDFLGKKWPFIIASMVLMFAGIGSLVMKGGPRYGIDFRGGTLVYVKFADRPPIERLRSALSAKLGGVPEVQEVTGTNEVIIGTEMRDEKEQERGRAAILETLATTTGAQQSGKLDVNNTGAGALADRLRGPLAGAGVSLSEPQLQDLATNIRTFRDEAPRSGVVKSVDDLRAAPGVTPQILQVLKQELDAAPYGIRNIEIVGPKMGEELRRQALYVVLAALAGMLIYIAFRFEWIYGVAAVLAVFHDTLVTIGIFSIMNEEITLTVVAALLTLVGYSMNDTIVVFDRIRENLKLSKRGSFPELVNASINQTLSRTILTSGLTFLTALSLLVFGGPVLRGFSLALVIGILIGTYSSVFIASPIVIWARDWLEGRKHNRQLATSQATPLRGRAPAKSAK